jgi:hypothetical protein
MVPYLGFALVLPVPGGQKKKVYFPLESKLSFFNGLALWIDAEKDRAGGLR